MLAQLQKLAMIGTILTCCGASHAAQTSVNNLAQISPTTEDNIEVVPLSTDEHASGYVIFVRNGVRQHRHNHHSETILVLEGKALMTLNDEQFEVTAGDYVHIPQRALHSVKQVLSDTPLKVLSIQAPEFLGQDREFVD